MSTEIFNYYNYHVNDQIHVLLPNPRKFVTFAINIYKNCSQTSEYFRQCSYPQLCSNSCARAKRYHEYMVMGSRQIINVNADENINITINDQPVKKVNETETLGMTIDQHLTWSRHVEEKSKKNASAIGGLERIRPFITIDTANKIYKALIQPHIDYCSTVWDGVSLTLLDKIQKLQNRAARVITQSNYYTSTGSLNVSTCWKKLKAVLMFKTLNNQAPAYLRDLFTYAMRTIG